MIKLKHSLGKEIVFLTIVGATIWSLAIGGSLSWNISKAKQQTIALAEKEAWTILSKDRAIRLWATSHGGVYVPVDGRTPPSPHLSHIPERDLVTPSGRKLTLMNPAYIMRQVMEEFAELYGITGHLTGLKQLNPDNAPDEWEKKAITGSQLGAEDFAEVSEMNGTPYLRALLPMITEKSCLRCHEQQGFEEGGIYGGVSISIPINGYLDLQNHTIKTLGYTHGLIWFLGLGFLLLVSYAMKQRILEREKTAGQMKTYANTLAQRNEELQSFAYHISHDLREPLVLIRGFSDRLRKKHATLLPDKGVEYLKRIDVTSARMQELIDGLLLYSRVNSTQGKFMAVDLAREIADVLADLEVQITRTQGMVEVADLPVIEADPLQIRQLMQNLISNSLKYHAPDTHPHILVQGEIVKGNLGTALCEITVRDNGIGFEESRAEEIFEIFHRLHDKTQYEGAGVGLAICKKIVERHGGKITARSKPGQGTTITIELPLKQS
jgi:signal transduction histidine kinase